MVLQVDHIGYMDRGAIEGEASALPGKGSAVLWRGLWGAIATLLMYSVMAVSESRSSHWTCTLQSDFLCNLMLWLTCRL